MTVSRARKFRKDNTGASALEFALVALPFLLLVIGTIEFSRLLWTRQAMQSLAISTARCMGVLQDNCAASGSYSSTRTTAYLISQAAAIGVPLVATNMSLNAGASCGAIGGFSSVSIAYKFTTVTPIVSGLVGGIPLTATACFPNQS